MRRSVPPSHVRSTCRTKPSSAFTYKRASRSLAVFLTLVVEDMAVVREARFCYLRAIVPIKEGKAMKMVSQILENSCEPVTAGVLWHETLKRLSIAGPHSARPPVTASFLSAA